MKKNRSMIGTLIAVILIILLLNPQWLPVSMETREKIRDLEKSYFLIERSGRITVAHILTVLLMFSVLWVINVVVKWIIQYFSKKSLRAQTIGDLLAGTFHYLIVIIGVVWGLAILGVNTRDLIVMGVNEKQIGDEELGRFIVKDARLHVGFVIRKQNRVKLKARAVTGIDDVALQPENPAEPDEKQNHQHEQLHQKH